MSACKPLTLLVSLVVLLGAAGCNTLKTATERHDDSPVQTPDPTPNPGETTSDQINLRSLGSRVPVIMYHDIIPRRGIKGTVFFDCTTAEFQAQMDRIKDEGLRPISLDDLYRHLTQGQPVPPGSIVLTFDDNYQGFYDIAWPILKQYNFPSAMFVHTGYVGTTTGRAHMSWETLAKLVASGLVTIGSHTISHPDLTTIDPASIENELTGSKNDLESKLNIKVDYFAYPDGKNNVNTWAAVRAAGYKMAFSIENGLAEESPDIECVNRYIQLRLDKALDDLHASQGGGIGLALGPVRDGPVAFKEMPVDGFTLAMVSGGKIVSNVSQAREGVLDFMHRIPGAVAGINGTFFDMAAIQSTDNKLVGPCLTKDQTTVIPDLEPDRWPRVRNRPVLMWGPTQYAIVPYNPQLMNSDLVYRQLMPDVTDVFMGGAWLVHSGTARTADEILTYGSKDAEDPRRRAALGFMPDGTPVAAASKDSVSSSKFAEMLAQAGVDEAILLDSGFSTSLVYGEKIMASGHSTLTEPSRPVPHAVLFVGDLDPASQAAADAAKPATDPIVAKGHHGIRRRRRQTQQ